MLKDPSTKGSSLVARFEFDIVPPVPQVVVVLRGFPVFKMTPVTFVAFIDHPITKRKVSRDMESFYARKTHGERTRALRRERPTARMPALHLCPIPGDV